MLLLASFPDSLSYTVQYIHCRMWQKPAWQGAWEQG